MPMPYICAMFILIYVHWTILSVSRVGKILTSFYPRTAHNCLTSLMFYKVNWYGQPSRLLNISCNKNHILADWQPQICWQLYITCIVHNCYHNFLLLLQVLQSLLMYIVKCIFRLRYSAYVIKKALQNRKEQLLVMYNIACTLHKHFQASFFW